MSEEKKDANQTPNVAAGNTKPTSDQGDKTPPANSPDHRIKVAGDKEELAKAAKAALKKSQDKVILVPVDFSPHAEAALVFAAELAEAMSASLVVLHVVHDPGEMPGYYSRLVKKKRVDRIQDIAREVFDDFMKHAISKHRGHKAIRKSQGLMVTGLPVTRILEVAEKVKPMMLVMGSQGRTGLKHLFLGSKAEQVVQLCPMPVTIVKHTL
jgi:nucleotide-binding universal stress UspA family protein